MAYRSVNFGSARAGLATVGYKLQASSGTIGGRVTAGEVGTSTGIYGANVDESANPIRILWDSGEATPAYAVEDLNVGLSAQAKADVTSSVPAQEAPNPTPIADAVRAALAADPVPIANPNERRPR